MKKIRYSARPDPENTARAIGRELDISPKAAVEVCREIRNMKVEDAIAKLEGVKSLTTPIRYKRYNKQVGHRKGKRFGSGRYPQKTASAIQAVIEHAQHNAEYKGLDSENMRIIHIASSRGMTRESFLPRAHGRSAPFNHETVNIEVILEVMEE